MANLSATIGQINSAWQTLFQRWERTKEVWNDSVRWDFEKEYWTPLEKQTQATQREMEKLAQIIAQAQRSVK